ncbi:unnamed protein product [Staurois parvus]|nr:unnamed protein product [Staurois parvus]
MVDMKKLKDLGKDRIGDEEDLNLGTSFSAETNRRDEDADMMKYIETELKKRKGIIENEEKKVKPKSAEDCLYELPESIKVSSAKKTEEMLSNQMLSGIPEVDLGIDAKIKNIISTEEAKARLLAEQQNKKKGQTDLLCTNQHGCQLCSAQSILPGGPEYSHKTSQRGTQSPTSPCRRHREARTREVSTQPQASIKREGHG